jgi:hypothetical protein
MFFLSAVKFCVVGYGKLLFHGRNTFSVINSQVTSNSRTVKREEIKSLSPKPSPVPLIFQHYDIRTRTALFWAISQQVTVYFLPGQ